jgi:hypothetical protein
MHNEWHIQRIPKQLHGHLHGWHLEFFLNLEEFFKYDILFSTNFSRKNCMPNCYHHSKVEFLGATWSSTMASHWIGKKFKLLRSSLFGNLIFSLWCFMFIGICRFLSRIIQKLLFFWHNLQAMRNSNGILKML